MVGRSRASTRGTEQKVGVFSNYPVKIVPGLTLPDCKYLHTHCDSVFLDDFDIVL